MTKDQREMLEKLEKEKKLYWSKSSPREAVLLSSLVDLDLAEIIRGEGGFIAWQLK